MKVNSKVLLAVATVAVSGLGFATSAFAQSVGVGGVAGSASFQLSPTGQVQGAAVSAAVGKDTAYAGANATPFYNGISNPNFKLDAFAVGTGGTITTTADNNSNGVYYYNSTPSNNYIYKVTPDTARGVAQQNIMGGSIDINATKGTASSTGSTSVTTAPAPLAN